MSVTLRQALSRRAFGRAFAAGAATLGLGAPATSATDAAAPTLDPSLRDAALRGLALADHRGDPVSARQAAEAIDRLARTDPEGALLARLYRALDVRPAGRYWIDAPAAAPDALALLHDAIAASKPVGFSYTDQTDQLTRRAVLPLALVHPPQGIKLLAWCEMRQGYRQFFVREMRDLTSLTGDFTQARLTLLQGLVDKERA